MNEYHRGDKVRLSYDPKRTVGTITGVWLGIGTGTDEVEWPNGSKTMEYTMYLVPVRTKQ